MRKDIGKGRGKKEKGVEKIKIRKRTKCTAQKKCLWIYHTEIFFLDVSSNEMLVAH